MLKIDQINTKAYVPALESHMEVEIKDDIRKELL
jgi:hypothetical protein